MIYEQINDIIDEWMGKEKGVCYEDDEGEEVFLDDEIEAIFNKNDIRHYCITADPIFENPSVTIYSVSVVWIENQELKTILNQKICRF